MDVSFISATLVLPAVLRCARAGPPSAGFELVVLVKPQFEAGRGQVGKGGIVRDPLAQQTAVARVASRRWRNLGGEEIEVIESPILGAEGNREFLLHARFGPGARIRKKATLTEFDPSHMKSAAIISKPSKPELADILPELLSWFRQRGYQLYLDKETAQYTDGEEVVSRKAIGSQAPGLRSRARWGRYSALRRARRGARRCSHPRRQPGLAGISDRSAAERNVLHPGSG